MDIELPLEERAELWLRRHARDGNVRLLEAGRLIEDLLNEVERLKEIEYMYQELCL